MKTKARRTSQAQLRAVLGRYGAKLRAWDKAEGSVVPDEELEFARARWLGITLPDGTYSQVEFENLRTIHSVWSLELLRHELGIPRRAWWQTVEAVLQERGSVRP